MTALSTIAMSVYNILAMARGPASVQQISDALDVYEMKYDNRLGDAIAALLFRGWVFRDDESSMYYLKDKLSRQAISRRDSGKPGDDGWLDWKVGDAVRGVVPISEATK